MRAILVDTHLESRNKRGLGVLFAQLGLNQTGHGRNDRYGDNADDQQLKVLLHNLIATKEVAQ